MEELGLGTLNWEEVGWDRMGLREVGIEKRTEETIFKRIGTVNFTTGTQDVLQRHVSLQELYPCDAEADLIRFAIPYLKT